MLATVLLITFVSVGARVFTPCEFANELLKPKHKVNVWQIPTWVCLAHHASALNTRYKHGNHYFGIFRFSVYWCSKCGYNCSDLANDDDVSKDIDCAVNVVYKEHEGSKNGFHGWGDWYTEFCSEPWKNLKNFDCKIGSSDSGTPSESIPETNSTVHLIPTLHLPSSERDHSTNSNPGFLSTRSAFYWIDFFTVAVFCSIFMVIIIVLFFIYRSEPYVRLT